MAKVELIEFADGDMYQYPECSYNDKQRSMGSFLVEGGTVPAVRCENAYCVTRQKNGTCPYEANHG